MKMFSICCLIVFVSLFGMGAVLVCAAEPEEITIVFFQAGYPPFYMADAEGGMYPDFLEAFALAHPEFNIIWKGLPRKRIDPAMESGDAQASSLTSPMFVGEKAADYLFSDAIWTSGNYIVMHKDNVFEYHEPTDLFGRKLGVILGNRNGVLDQYIESGEIEAVSVRNNTALYRALERQIVDAIIAIKQVALYEIKQEQMDVSQFVFAEPPLFEYELMTQIQKTHQHFLDALNAFIQQSKQNGLLHDITSKYVE